MLVSACYLQVLQRCLNARQFALKLIANVSYGYTSASFSGRMPCAELADAIVQVRQRGVTYTAGSWTPTKTTWQPAPASRPRALTDVLMYIAQAAAALCPEQACCLLPCKPAARCATRREQARCGPALLCAVP
jgi:hypothetical protein